jgi:hypothetical protein
MSPQGKLVETILEELESRVNTSGRGADQRQDGRHR